MAELMGLIVGLIDTFEMLELYHYNEFDLVHTQKHLHIQKYRTAHRQHRRRRTTISLLHLGNRSLEDLLVHHRRNLERRLQQALQRQCRLSFLYRCRQMQLWFLFPFFSALALSLCRMEVRLKRKRQKRNERRRLELKGLILYYLRLHVSI